jgi:hypothetical protein
LTESKAYANVILGTKKHMSETAFAPTPTSNLPPDPFEAVRLSPDRHEWHDRMAALMAQDPPPRIIALRGAGAINGIDEKAALHVTDELHSHITSFTDQGKPVVLMYDGDPHNEDVPDVGTIFGRLTDRLADEGNNLVTPMAVQVTSEAEGGPLRSAGGRPYETYALQSDNGDYFAATTLTQSDALVAYPEYEQFIVGPVGKTADRQLRDLGERVRAHRPADAGNLDVTILPTPNNSAPAGQLMESVRQNEDDLRRQGAAVMGLVQRVTEPYGALVSSQGELSIDRSQFPGINFRLQNGL